MKHRAVSSPGLKLRPKSPVFKAEAFLLSAGIAHTRVKYRAGAKIFAQGEACHEVMCIKSGSVKLSVRSKIGREAVVATLGPGDFFGEGCLAGQPRRIGTATAMLVSVILAIPKVAMRRVLHKQHAMSDTFITHMLARHVRIEQDLIDHLFNSNEKRLARVLLLLARYGRQKAPVRAVPKLSPELLATMIGSTRGRVTFFLRKFKRLGFIEDSAGLKVNSSLLTVVLHD